MTLNLTLPQQTYSDFTPRITVIGVGGGGTNAVDNMIQLQLQGVEFVVANTDAQQLTHSRADRRIQLGPHLTQGLGAGAKPEIGRAAAEEAEDELSRHLDGAHMVFITAGMGGGTGTGAAPVIARMARERGILTVGVVTKPFTFEGIRRAKAAETGIAELQQFVDTLIVIPNQNLFRLANERTGWKEAFKMADHVLYMGVRGVTDLMVAPGLVNLDFADIRTVMAEMGKAMMGTGEADGDNRAIRAAEAAISNPLLEDTSMAGARGLLINITGGDDMTLFEVDQAANRIREEVAEDANIIFGSAIDEGLTGRIRVSVVATGIDNPLPQQVGGDAARGQQAGQPGMVPGGVGQGGIGQGGMAQPGLAHPGAAPPARPVARPLSNPFTPPPSALASAGFGGRPARKGVAATGPIGAPVLTPRAGAATGPAIGAASGAPAAGSEPWAQQPASGQAAGRGPADSSPGSMQAPPADALPHQPQGVAARAASPRSGLFSEPPRPASEPNAAGGPNRSLFGIVTGALRRGATPGAPAPGEPRRNEPQFGEAAEPSASVRPVAGEEAGLDIPAFLRRQS